MNIAKRFTGPLLAGLFVCALTACGGGGGHASLTVDVYGNSIVRGVGVSVSPLDRLRERGLVVEDHSAVGLTLRAAMAGYTEPFSGAPKGDYPAGAQPPFAQVPRHSAVVVIELGGNDALEMRHPAEYEADLREAIRIVQAEGRTAVLTGIVDLPVADIFTPPIKARRDELNAVTLRVAAELGLQHAGWGEDYHGPQDVFDNVHRTQAASDRLAALLVQAIERGGR